MSESDSDSVEGLNDKLKSLNTFCTNNRLKVNMEKTKCMTFNRTGRLIRRNFFLNGIKLENVRSYKYLGLMFTPSGEIKSALDDLRSRALKAYMSLKHKLGTIFYAYVDETTKIFDTMIKPILLYSSDFWGCLKLPKNNPVENLHSMFCKQLLQVQKSTTNIGVLLEVGRTPLMLTAQKLAVKNWDRIRRSNANELLKFSYVDANTESLTWFVRIKDCLAENGICQITDNLIIPDINNVHVKLFNRLTDIFHQQSFEAIKKPDSKLRTYSLIKEGVGIENYLKCIHNHNHRSELTKFRLSNHKLMIEVGRHQKIPLENRFCPSCPNVVEDEIHFLINCELYREIRKPIIEKCNDLKQNFAYYSDQQKFIFIMKSPLLVFDLTRFISSAIKEKNLLL